MKMDVGKMFAITKCCKKKDAIDTNSNMFIYLFNIYFISLLKFTTLLIDGDL